MTILSRVLNNEQMLKITAEFTRLRDKCYLENAGAVLYPRSLLNLVNEDLLNNVYMNPHSDKYTRDCIEQIRSLILKHFNTDLSKYSVIFTAGTTQSLKLILEAFDFGCDESEALNRGSFVYLRDNHTSVLGLRELAEDKNADVIHISHDNFLQAISSAQLTTRKEKYETEGKTLFVYPAQSNFNGYKYPINCIQNIKQGCLNNLIKQYSCKINCNWYILLDAASFVATDKLDLSKTQPDFVCLSFYKMFGYPTGLGAILIKNSSGDVLNQKRYFGGGTVDIVLSSEDFHVKRESLHERFEDGTVSFLSILALKHCFDTMYKLIPKVISDDLMDTIAYHTYYLAQDLYQQLKDLRHPNSSKAAILYSDSEFADIRKQGGIVTFNLLREDGSYIGYAEFQHMADLFNISVRTGCFCNSGSCQRHLNVSNKEMKDMYKNGHKCGDEIDLINNRPTGAVRVSFGYYNTFNDVDKLMRMICRCFVKSKFKIPEREVNNSIDIKISKRNKISKKSPPRIFNDKECLKSCGNNTNIPQLDGNIVLKEIVIYPIKSCGAFKIRSEWKIGSKGFEYDREWMIVKDNGVCLTQKQNTQMCMIRPVVDLRRKLLILNFKGKRPISVPLDPEVESEPQTTSFCHSKVCTDTVKGYDCGDEVAEWISEALDISFLRLIKQSNSDIRFQNKKEKEKLLSLSNQAQFLLINKATVRWLSSKIKDSTFTDDLNQLTDRFRGNLIIDTAEELIEKEWQQLIIGKHEFKTEGQCRRCQMICIDQQTGEKTVEPLRTISEQFIGKMRFGIYVSYVGPLDGSQECVLTINSPVTPITSDDDISR